MTFDYNNDILPLGDFETVPVTSLIPPYPCNFPEVARLGIKTDIKQLKEDYENYDKSGDYFKSRAKYFKNSLKDTIQLFDKLGFSKSNYQAFPLRELGTNILKNNVGEYTKHLLLNFGVDLFRQQYVLAQAGWKTKLHIDHPDFTIHGFRVFIPIDDAYIGFEKNIYKLTAGDCYFVNIAKMHRGFSESDRVVIMCQMASDKLIRLADYIEPIDNNLIDEEYRYAE
jgi:mannose-6-phosphate isomerase class I